MSTEERPRSIAALMDAYNAAWSAHDVPAIVALHTEDSVFENHTSGGYAVGREAIAALLEGIFRTFPDLAFAARRTYLRDDLVVVEWTATATFAHPITRNGTVHPPTGKVLSWNGMDVIPIRDGLVARKDVYADSIGYLRQLGVERL